MCKWYEQEGREADCVVSTRVRLARNLQSLPFPARMTAENRQELNRRVWEALERPMAEAGLPLNRVEMDSLSDMQAMAMVERHCISPEFAREREGRLLLISENESVSIMVGEEDHIRIQALLPGLALDEAYTMAGSIDKILSESLDIAFDKRLGFLTACPTNLGTGLRASVMLHLPAIESRSAMGAITNMVSKIGLTVRGMYGEGSETKASLYQLSNQVTLGISEEAALSNLKSITGQILQRERTARQALDPDKLADMVWRSLGLLCTARILSGEEFMRLVSAVRLGTYMGITHADPAALARLLVDCQPAMLQLSAAGSENPLPMDAARRDKVRATHVRKVLGAAVCSQ